MLRSKLPGRLSSDRVCASPRACALRVGVEVLFWMRACVARGDELAPHPALDRRLRAPLYRVGTALGMTEHVVLM